MGWLRILLEKLNTVSRMSRERRRNIARAWVVVTLIQLALQGLPYRTVRKRITEAMDARASAVQPRDAKGICRRLAEDVAIAARNHFLPVSCLGKSLALHVLCRRAGCVTRLRIGVLRTSEYVRGHAWLEADGEILNDTPEVTSAFAALDRIPTPTPSSFSTDGRGICA